MNLFALVLITVLEGGTAELVIDTDMTMHACQEMNILMFNGYAQCVPMDKVEL